MVPRAQTAPTRLTFLVEHYRPGSHADELRRSAARVHEAVAALERDGRSVRYVRSTIVPGDESLFCVVEAETEQLVREAYTRAGLTFDRLSLAVTDEAV